MKLSIILRAYNRLEYTIRSIVSIDEKGGLDKSEYEIILLDQASTDGTREWALSAVSDRYYPLQYYRLEENLGDWKGMDYAIPSASGELIAQHDNDIILETENYYSQLISIYRFLKRKEISVCAIAGVHRQGYNDQASPIRIAKGKFEDPFLKVFINEKEYILAYSAWVTASFIFEKKLHGRFKFDKGMCNRFCAEYWDLGFYSFIATDLKFWHIDSGETGAHVKRQAQKFPSYLYVKKHYKNFI